MNVEKLITETFTAHEHVAADSDRVLAATRARIDRGRTVSRPLAVAAGVLVLTLAAATGVVLNRSEPTPTDNVATAADGVQITDLRMPFSFGWLPPGSADYQWQRVNVGGTADDPDTPVYNGEYMVSVTDNGQTLNVGVQQHQTGSVDQADLNGPDNPVTLDGQRGVESADASGPGGYELYLAHPDGGTMYVHVMAPYPSTAPAHQLVEVGRRVARNLRVPGDQTVTPSFGLRDLPDGMRICAFDVGKPWDSAPVGTTYSLGTCTTMPPITVSTSGEPRGNPGEPVQGHPTRQVDEDGSRSLWVLDAVDDTPILVAGSVPLADLYDIANRLVLPR